MNMKVTGRVFVKTYVNNYKPIELYLYVYVCIYYMSMCICLYTLIYFPVYGIYNICSTSKGA
jgi:hypothetical protein